MRIVVVGAGVFGAWSAWFLSAAGHQVTLIDAYGPANARASSADHSRVIRCGYGGDAIYSRWALQSLADWKQLSRDTGQSLIMTTGALFMGAPQNAYIEATYTTLESLQIAVERLTPNALATRYPQIAVVGLDVTLLEANAGVIRARAAVQALVAFMRERNVIDYRLGHLSVPDESVAPPQFRLTTGEPLAADVFVLACGPWLSALLPWAVGARIRVTQQEVLHYGVPAGDDRFALSRLPVWIDFDAGLYGIPDLDARGFKVGIDRHGPPIDPDVADRVVSRSVVERTREGLACRFPALAGAPLLDAHVCQYENTDTGDFIIDRHPSWPQVWIVGGGSGHGFKHGPAIGRHLTTLIAGAQTVDPRFALQTRHTNAARAVF